jgi:uncharacterized repeat protein (TIGR03803 family)
MFAVSGVLYGTTRDGGTGCGSGDFQGCGTAFAYDPLTGRNRVIYRFKGNADGGNPNGVTFVKNTLYGTNMGGGLGLGGGFGTAFAINPASSKERVLYAFKGGRDGATPLSRLIYVNGTLYGTTLYGGNAAGACESQQGCGTVFSLDPASGRERLIYRFKGGVDGAGPAAALIALNGSLYGTTAYGGYPRSCNPPGLQCGYGTVFAVDPRSGRERVVYRFSGAPDGSNPSGTLIERNGMLYGTTGTGGDPACECGTVFSIAPSSGVEQVVYIFLGRNNGSFPSGVIAFHGKLYGTTVDNCPIEGCGTVFSVDPASGTQSVLFRFSRAKVPNGLDPLTGLTILKGALYGSTAIGGAGCSINGCGTLFKVVQ